MVKRKQGKPVKKTDKELWLMIEQRIENKQYIIMPHAVDRQNTRNITDIDILDILENKETVKEKETKAKISTKIVILTGIIVLKD